MIILSDIILKRLHDYKNNLPYYDHRMDFVLILGTESWNMLYKEVGGYLSHFGYPQDSDSFMGMRVKVIDKKFHIEIIGEY